MDVLDAFLALKPFDLEQPAKGFNQHDHRLFWKGPHLMANIASILAEKGSQVLTISKSMTVLEAARMMNEHKCGSLLVTEDDQLHGIITERDVLSRVVAEQRDPASTPVVTVMTPEIAVCTTETTLEEARAVMRNRRIRHLPVVNEHNHLIGLVSIGDLNAYHLEGQEKTIHLLHEYIYGQTISQ